MKKNFALLMVVFMVIGFAACDKQPAVGTPVSIDDHTQTNELWRGIVTGNVQTFSDMAIIQVEDPKDNLDYRFKVFVIFHVDGPAKHIIPNIIKVGTEIYFYKLLVYSESLGVEFLRIGSCNIGFYFGHVTDSTPYTRGKIIKNPPAK